MVDTIYDLKSMFASVIVKNIFLTYYGRNNIPKYTFHRKNESLIYIYPYFYNIYKSV